MLKEFKEFLMRGNVVDLAVAVVIGAAFSKIVDSMVNDVLVPIIGAVTGGLNFTNYFTPLSKAVSAESLVEAMKQGAVLAWGNFLQVSVNLVIIAAVLFLILRDIDTFKSHIQPPQPAGTPPRPAQEILPEEIRDLLARNVNGVPIPGGADGRPRL